MRKVILLSRPVRAGLCLWALALAYVCGGVACARAQGLNQPGEVLETPLDFAPWIRLFARVATAETVYSKFHEERWFPIRKDPVKLEGEMRYSNERGLSLAYTAPQVSVLILDDQGLLMRDAKGRERTAPADTEAGGLSQALRAVVRLDFDEMQDRFVVRGVKDGDAWRLDLEPRDAPSRKRLGTLTVWGRGDQVARLQLGHGPKQRVVVTILESQFNRVFSEDEVRRCFRRRR